MMRRRRWECPLTVRTGGAAMEVFLWMRVPQHFSVARVSRRFMRLSNHGISHRSACSVRRTSKKWGRRLSKVFLHYILFVSGHEGEHFVHMRRGSGHTLSCPVSPNGFHVF